MKLLLIVFLLTAIPVHAQYVGLSAYAALSERFPCDRYLRIVSKSHYPAMSVLWGSFGNDTTCIAKFLNRVSHKPHLLQIHFSNEVCRRNRNCGVGEFRRQILVAEMNRLLEQNDTTTLRRISDRVERIRKTIEPLTNGNTTLLLSTGLEDQFSRKAYRHLLRAIRSNWPYLINRNPVNGHDGYFASAEFLERHGGSVSCSRGLAVANEDGALQNVSESRSFLRRAQDCFLSLLWRPEHQGRTRDGRPVYPRRSREFEIRAEDVRELGQLLKEAS